jgi:hypothetical protein
VSKVAEIQENRTVIQDYPGARNRVVESEYEQVVHERRGPSGAAIAAMVIGAMIAAIIITLIIVNSRQDTLEDQVALERERAMAAERSAGQTTQQQPAQQPSVVVVPQPSQPTAVPVPVPVPVPSPSTPTDSSSSTKPSAVSIEVDVNSKFLDDTELNTIPIQVKYVDGAVTLTGEVPSDALKQKAEKIAATVKGVRRVINNLTVNE